MANKFCKLSINFANCKFKRMNKGLIALACGGLAIGMTEFTMMGILQDIAKDQQIEKIGRAHV